MISSCTNRAWLLMLGVAVLSGTQRSAADESHADADAVAFFEAKVRPLLVARCHECHAGEKHKGGLRLDSRSAVLQGGDTGPAIVPGNPDASLLVDAVRYGDTYQMPPKSQLPPDEIATLVEWVRLGAPWGVEASPAGGASPPQAFDLQARAAHWSFQPLADPAPPHVVNHNWIKTPVDRFILAKLEAADLAPSAPADRQTLLRRLTFDLTGLPPTTEEIEAFLADASPTAYETVVERLLASPRYGERWARHWLDLVRYAETQGHEFDFDIPNAHRYRDYVIRAFNDDLPYDQFVVEHIAGDLLPEPRRHAGEGFNESILATGWYFLGEAVHSPVDVRADQAHRIDNQIDVLAKAFLGLTVSCARCHDHKFDAISTKDYYALAGYLQSSRYQQAFLDPPESLAEPISKLEEIHDARRQACVGFARAAVAPRLAQAAEALLADRAGAEDGAEWQQLDHPLYAWAALHLAPAEDSSGSFGPRRVGLVAQLKSRLKPQASAAAGEPVIFADFQGLDYGPWQTTGDAFGNAPARPFDWAFVGPRGRFPGRMMTTGTAHSGLVSPKLHGTLRSPTFEITHPKIWYRLHGDGKVRLIVDGLQLIRNPIYGDLEFKPAGHQPQWHKQDVSKWIGHRAYIELIDDGDGYLALEQVAFSEAGPPTAEPNPIVVAMLDDDAIDTPEALAAAYQTMLLRTLNDWLAGTAADYDTAAASATVVTWLLEQQLFDPSGMKSAEVAFDASLAALDERQRAIELAIAAPRQAPAMADGTAVNERVFIRGNHKTLGEEVPRRFLEVLGGTECVPPADGSGRLQLARQMVSPDGPLVPRVIVNRLWHHHFGAGLVRSPDDFGVMGQPPTHPELLDFLAGELVRCGWSLKHLHRLMVHSATYRMSSRVRDAADRADPQNRLWHRMNVRRLEAESIRDAVLFVSGGLDAAMYGPGVMPHLTEFMAGRGRPKESGPLDGDGRRSVYLAVRRNFLPPLFLAFDYPTPFTTIGRRGTSNVPAQALAMMNNPLVAEQARCWADRTLKHPQQSADQRVRAMYVAALAREPDNGELQAALDFVQSAAGADAERQAWADFAHVLLNLKEFIYVP